jgi:elongation factor P
LVPSRRIEGGRPVRLLISSAASLFVRLGGCCRTAAPTSLDPPHSEGNDCAMATTNDLKNGMVLNLDGQLWSVIWFQHHKPGKGGAVVRTKLKNIESGKTVDKTFNADVKVDIANVDKRTMQYLYNDGTSYVFMDTATFEQTEVPPEIVGDATNFLLENQEAIVATNEGRVLYIELPASVELLVEYTEPGMQGDRSTGGTKPAKLETGHEIQVPLFITTGEKIKVDTRDSSYLGRVSQ